MGWGGVAGGPRLRAVVLGDEVWSRPHARQRPGVVWRLLNIRRGLAAVRLAGLVRRAGSWLTARRSLALALPLSFHFPFLFRDPLTTYSSPVRCHPLGRCVRCCCRRAGSRLVFNGREGGRADPRTGAGSWMRTVPVPRVGGIVSLCIVEDAPRSLTAVYNFGLPFRNLRRSRDRGGPRHPCHPGQLCTWRRSTTSTTPLVTGHEPRTIALRACSSCFPWPVRVCWHSAVCMPPRGRPFAFLVYCR